MSDDIHGMNYFYKYENFNKYTKYECFVMNLLYKRYGYNCIRSTDRENIYDHIDFFVTNPKLNNSKISIEVKGIKKEKREDVWFNDAIQWIEHTGRSGYPGWVYGKADFIVFVTFSDIIFVPTKELRKLSEQVLELEEIVHEVPKKCYIPYNRKHTGDIIFKMPTQDLRDLGCKNLKTLNFNQEEKKEVILIANQIFRELKTGRK